MSECGDQKQVVRAESREELAPLVDLCKRGCLYDVQAWIAAGKPVNPPETPPKKPRIFSPLYHAIEVGFHSLVAVLLEGGAAIEYHRTTYTSVGHAAGKRRLDLVKLLVEHGADVRRTPVEEAFDSWDPGIMELFIEQGADMETERPLAMALSHGIRPALGILKRHQNRFPSFREQANIALRHHCAEGCERWVALLLWAGADPFLPGDDGNDDEPDPDDPGISAVECAVSAGHHELFELPWFVKRRAHPGMRGALRYAHQPKAADTIRVLLKAGLDPNDQPNGGSSAVQELLVGLRSCLHYGCRLGKLVTSVDHAQVRASIASLDALAENGAVWRPLDRRDVTEARKGLCNVDRAEVMEIVTILCRYGACSREALDLLLAGNLVAKVCFDWSKIEPLADKLASYPVPKAPEGKGRRGAKS